VNDSLPLAAARQNKPKSPPFMTIASLLNLGGPDLLIILMIVLFIFGGKKLPELARGLGQAMREFTKAKDQGE
jgi:sec-independent protein translocase protein TatA